MKRIIDQKAVPSISKMEDVEKFILSPLETCILLDIHLSHLQDAIDHIHQAGKFAIVHLDRVRGISKDEDGCDYVIQRLGADGIISTEPTIIERAKKNECVTIQRLFLSDSRTLDKELNLLNITQPDFAEILPALACQIFPQIKLRIQSKILGGGLIKTQEQIYDCLINGASAVTISSLSLCEQFFRTQNF